MTGGRGFLHIVCILGTRLSDVHGCTNGRRIRDLHVPRLQARVLRAPAMTWMSRSGLGRRRHRTGLGGVIVLDMEVAGARNVFMKIGAGRIHFYDQAPKMPGPGSIHHFGIQTDEVEKDYRRMESAGIAFKKTVTDLGYMKYIMVPAPDSVLIELFEVNKSVIPTEYRDYFA